MTLRVGEVEVSRSLSDAPRTEYSTFGPAGELTEKRARVPFLMAQGQQHETPP